MENPCGNVRQDSGAFLLTTELFERANLSAGRIQTMLTCTKVPESCLTLRYQGSDTRKLGTGNKKWETREWVNGTATHKW